MNDSSLARLDPDFMIPLGTQVVVRAPKTLADGTLKPAGSVGEVVAQPPDNRFPYTVRFADEQTAEVPFAELSLRRREVDDELVRPAAEDLRQYVVYRVRVGSHAFGLAGADSDDDLRGVYLPPARLDWSLFKLPEQIESNQNGVDEVYWELEKFVRLALKANPNVLETLWTPHVLAADATGQALRAIRQAFLSRHLYKTYSGYVLSQFRRMANAYEKTGAYKAKHAMHLVRLILSGTSALETGEIRIDVSEHRAELLEIRAGKLTFDEVRARALALDRQFQTAFEKTSLPERPDYVRVDAMVIEARRRMVDG
jgi:predicted nucleotidyltransferase